jgi:hypothetical protein
MGSTMPSPDWGGPQGLPVQYIIPTVGGTLLGSGVGGHPTSASKLRHMIDNSIFVVLLQVGPGLPIHYRNAVC